MIHFEANYLTQSIREVDISPDTIPKGENGKCWRSYHITKEESEAALINDQLECYLKAAEQADKEYQRLINLINKVQ